MTFGEAQELVDGWIRKYGVRYFNELTNMAILAEEVGEVARIIARTYGEQSDRPAGGEQSDRPAGGEQSDRHADGEQSDRPAGGENKELADELADVLFVLICLANQTGTDLEAAFQKNLKKKTSRDFDRHQQNDKLR